MSLRNLKAFFSFFVLCHVAISIPLSVRFLSAEENKRLIQTGPDTKIWMTEDELVGFVRDVYRRGHFGGYMDITGHPNKKAILNLPFDSFGTFEPKHHKKVGELISQLSAISLSETIQKLSSFKNRYYQSESGLAAATWIRDQFNTLARGRTDIEVSMVQHSFKQPSVIARITGKTPNKAHETVILGGHSDTLSTNFGIPVPNGIQPGADDNASGISTMLEVFRAIIETGFRPERTVEFIAYAGEKHGLLGSLDIAQQYQKTNRKIVGVLQLDMTMHPGRLPYISLVSDYTDRNLTKFLGMLIDTYVKVPWKEISCGYACSDHTAWHDAGFAAAFPFESLIEESNPNMDTPDDTIDNLDPLFGLHFAKLAAAFAVELSTGEGLQ